MATQVTPRSAVPPTPTRPPTRQPRPSGLRNWLYRADVKGAPYAYVSPFFLLYALFGLVPVVYTGWVSLHDWNLTQTEHTYVGLANYAELLHDEYFYAALGNTLSILVLATIPQLLLALGLASLLNARLRGNTFWRMGMLLPNVTSVVAVAVIFSQLFGRDYGFVNWVLDDVLSLGRVDWDNSRATSHVAIAVMVTWRWTGYNALIFLAAMQAIPGELYESAKLDGASTFQQLRKITIPMIRPTIVFVVITSVIYGMQIFAEPQIFGGAGPDGVTGGSGRQFQTLTLYLYEMGWSKFELGYGSAIAYAMFAVIGVVTALNYLVIRRIRSSS